MKLPVLSVDADIDEVLWPNRRILTFVGLWPFRPSDGSFVRAFSFFRLCFTLFIALFTVIPQCLTICKYWGDIVILTENGCVMLAIALMVFKTFYALIRHNDFRNVHEILTDLWSLPRNQEERNGVAIFANQSKLCILVFFYSGVTDVIVFICASILICVNNYVRANGTHYHHSLPLNIWYGIDTQTSPNFEFLFISQCLGMLFAALFVIGFDSTIMTIIMHLIGQFRMISLRFKVIGRKIRDGAKFDSKCKNKLWLEMESCIRHHQDILKRQSPTKYVTLLIPTYLVSLFQYVDELINPITFGQLLLAGLEICLSGFAIIEGGNGGTDVVKFSFLLVSMIMQLMICCWPGELAIRESTNIARVVFYEIPWSMLTCSEQRNLALVVCRAQKQCQVTALGLQTMCLRKFCEVCNSALSYMALLRRMKEK